MVRTSRRGRDNPGSTPGVGMYSTSPKCELRLSARSARCGSRVDFHEGVNVAAIAQLGERQTEDLKVPGSIPGLGILGRRVL